MPVLYLSGVASGLGIRSFLEQRQFARAERIYPEIAVSPGICSSTACD
jgi:hypothetical protein